MIISAVQRDLWTLATFLLLWTGVTTGELLWTKVVGTGELRCDRWVAEVSQQEQQVQVIQPPNLHGKWVSKDCEIRPGPEYLLRKYQFSKNGSFTAIQFYYDDQSCTRPRYTVIANGKLRTRDPSWTTPGATEAEYFLQSVRVVSYSADVADWLGSKVNSSCPGYVVKQWRAFREYSLYRYVESRTTDNRYGVEVVEDVDCLSALSWTLHELQLMKQEKRASRESGSRVAQVQLLLGDIHTRQKSREQYRPTAFQPPMLKANQVYGCHVCHVVGKSNAQSPPHLPAKPRLPVYLAGEWLSQRCEVRAHGLFVTRRIRFFGSSSHRWQGLYHYYADPRCTIPTYSVIAKGTYQEGGPCTKVDGATRFDFKVSGVIITPQDEWTVNSLNGHKGNICGSDGTWELGQSQDVTASYGCRGLGIKVPSVEYDLVKMELNPQGTPLLFLGLPDTNNRRSTSSDRPTAYQWPLIQCSMSPFLGPRDLDLDTPNHLHPLLNARMLKISSHSSRPNGAVLLIVALTLWWLVTK